MHFLYYLNQLLQFQQKKSGGKKKKKPKSSKGLNEGDSLQQSGEIGGNSPSNSEQDASIASADTDKDISSIASEVEEQIAPPQQVYLNINLKHGYVSYG